MLRRVAVIAASTVLVLGGSAAVLRAVDFRQAQSTDSSPSVSAQAPAPNRPGKG